MIGSPPCSTVASFRFNKRFPGPRPLRFRDCFWEGRDGLREWERQRLVEANALCLHWLAIIEAVAARAGKYFHEHPKDKGYAPFPSIYATEEFLSLEERARGIRKTFDQCRFDGPERTSTEISSNFVGLEVFDNACCPGVSQLHAHEGLYMGTDPSGNFCTRRLQRYPVELCKAIATCVMDSIKRMIVSG